MKDKTIKELKEELTKVKAVNESLNKECEENAKIKALLIAAGLVTEEKFEEAARLLY